MRNGRVIFEMSEEVSPSQIDSELEGEQSKNGGVSKAKGNKKKSNVKKPNNKDDFYVILMPEKIKSLRGRIANRIIEIVREEPLISEKEIILKLVARDDEIKKYFEETQDVSYIRFIIWELVKKNLLKKVKIFGDDKHVYFVLPEQIEQFKEKIIKAPKESSE
jgi:hypothetical protein